MTFTRAELRRVRALAVAHGYTVTDMLRMGVLMISDDLLDPGDPLIVDGFIRTTIYARA